MNPHHNPKPGSLRHTALLAAAKAHDMEEASQKGEPSPWSIPEAAGDEEWRSERVCAMSCAVDAYHKAFDGERSRAVLPHLALAALVVMHRDGTLSEGQMCQFLDIDRVSMRRLMDEMP